MNRFLGLALDVSTPNMSELTAQVATSANGFTVTGHEEINYGKLVYISSLVVV